MELIRALSKTEQVVNFLRDEIKKRNLPTGSRLASSRVLAKRFGTSKRVVEDAFKVLADEGVIHKRARSGVFVNKPHGVAHLKEVYILGIGVRDGEPFFNEVLKLASPSFMRKGFTFLVRAYPPEIEINTVLDIEKSRISKMSEVDCLLVTSSRLEKEHVLRCLEFEKPVLFIGDFSNTNMENIDLNQIMLDNAYQGKFAVDWMRDYSINEITLFSGSSEHLFNRQYIAEAIARAAELKMDLGVVELPKGFSSLLKDEKRDVFSKIVRRSLRDGRMRSGGVIMNIGDRTLLLEVVEKIAPEVYANLTIMPKHFSDFDLFRKEIIKRVNELIVDKNAASKKIRLQLPISLENNTRNLINF